MQRERAGPRAANAPAPTESQILWGLLQQPPSQAIADRINSVLIAMRLPGNEKSEAAVILRALAEKRFHDRADAQGRDCRREAVETLLACGFPHALNVDPEDLAYARAWRRAAHQPLLEEEDAEPPSRPNLPAVLLAMIAFGAQVTGAVIGEASGFALRLALAAATMFLVFAFLNRKKGRNLFFPSVLAVVFAMVCSAVSAASAYTWWPALGLFSAFLLLPTLPEHDSE